MSLQEPAQRDPVGACQTVPRKEDPHPAVEQIPVASTDGLNARLCRQIPLSRACNHQRVALPRDRLAGLADRMHRLRRQRVRLSEPAQKFRRVRLVAAQMQMRVK